MEPGTGILYKVVDPTSQLFKIDLPRHCAFHRQIKLHPVQTDQEYDLLKQDDFASFAYSYKRKSEQFDLQGLNLSVFERFIELLASLTLFHFSKSTKQIYYNCLDLRGLEYKEMIGHKLCSDEDVQLDGYEGKLVSKCSIKNENMRRFQVCHVKLDIWIWGPLDYGSLAFVKKYRVLDVLFCVVENMIEACDALFHPGVEHGYFMFPDLQYFQQLVTFQQIGQLLEYCTNLKTLDIDFEKARDEEWDFDDFEAWPHFSFPRPLKLMFEQFPSKTTRMQVFFISYRNHLFRIHANQLIHILKFPHGQWRSSRYDYALYQRLLGYVTVGQVLEWRSDKNEVCAEKYSKFPKHLVDSHHDDFLNILLRSECKNSFKKFFWNFF